MKNKMKEMIKKIDWSIVFLFLLIIFCVCVCVYAFNKLTAERPQVDYDEVRKAKLCCPFS